MRTITHRPEEPKVGNLAGAVLAVATTVGHGQNTARAALLAQLLPAISQDRRETHYRLVREALATYQQYAPAPTAGWNPPGHVTHPQPGHAMHQIARAAYDRLLEVLGEAVAENAEGVR